MEIKGKGGIKDSARVSALTHLTKGGALSRDEMQEEVGTGPEGSS